MVHLTIGILISFIRKMPSLSAIADIGWLFVLYGMYFFAMSFVMGTKYENPIVFCGITFNSMVVMGATINSLMLIILGIGFGLVLLFSEQNGKNIIKCALMGIAWSPLKALNSVSMFADLVSYIRLFAVGLAGFAVAESFNKMAGSLAGGVVGIILSAIILFVAHAFNMVLCLLSVIVHGVRLNMLEFGGKVGLEWSGHIYNPFRKKG
jgi:V/A-type H+-transporting ATPase subunit I